MFLIKMHSVDPLWVPQVMGMTIHDHVDRRGTRTFHGQFYIACSCREQAHALTRQIVARRGASANLFTSIIEDPMAYPHIPTHDVEYVLQKARIYLDADKFRIFEETFLGQRQDVPLIDALVTHAGWVQLTAATLLIDGLGARHAGAVWETRDVFGNSHYMSTVDGRMVAELGGRINSYTGQLMCSTDWRRIASDLVDTCAT